MEFRLTSRVFSGPAGPWLRLMRFDRPIGIALLLWPTWWGLFMAGNGHPSLSNFVIFTLGVVVMRAAGCVINDWADRDLDPHVARTESRPLASGELEPRQALYLFFALMLVAFGLVLMTNTLTVLLAFFGALLAGSYPFFKRFTHLPQIALGTAFAWAIPMAFAAETGRVPEPAWWLFALNLVWVLIYDTEYAMADRADDLAVGVRSTAMRTLETSLAPVLQATGVPRPYDDREAEWEHMMTGIARASREAYRGLVYADERFFAYIQTIDPHVPYDPPDAFLALGLRQERHAPCAQKGCGRRGGDQSGTPHWGTSTSSPEGWETNPAGSCSNSSAMRSSAATSDLRSRAAAVSWPSPSSENSSSAGRMSTSAS